MIGREPWESESQNDGVKHLQGEGRHFELNEEAGSSPVKGSDLPFDLEERTAKFGEAILRFVKKMPMNAANNRLIDQLVGCGTSIGDRAGVFIGPSNPSSHSPRSSKF